MSSSVPQSVQSTTETTSRQSNQVRSRRTGRNNRLGGSVLQASQTGFTGRTEGLSGYIFDCSVSNQADLYSKTVKELASYVGRTFTHYPADIRIAIEKLQVIRQPYPPRPRATPITGLDADAILDAADADAAARDIWKIRATEYVKRDNHLTQNLSSVYSIVWDQCTDALKRKIEAVDDYNVMSAEANGVTLLSTIKLLVYNYDSQKWLALSIADAREKCYNLFQGAKMSNSDYLEKFKNAFDVLEQCGGQLWEPGVLNQIYQEANLDDAAISALTTNQVTNYQQKAVEVSLAICFLRKADKERYGRLITNLKNDFTQGTGRYPLSLSAAYNVLVNWEEEPPRRRFQQATDGVNFTTTASTDSSITTLSTDTTSQIEDEVNLAITAGNKSTRKIVCSRCGKTGHYPSQCLEVITSSEDLKGKQQGKQLLISGHVLHTSNNQVPQNWILLDSESTVDVFSNPKYLNNIRDSNNHLVITSMAGATTATQIGDLPGYGQVWFEPKAIANVLSLSQVRKKFPVTYDSQAGNMFTIHKDDGNHITFAESSGGLYYYEVPNTTPGFTFVTTVADNKDRYTAREIKQATLARRIQQTIGRPNTRQYMNIVDQGLLPNCPVTRTDIQNAEDIFGAEIGALRGKTTRSNVDHVKIPMVDLPPELASRASPVTLCCDIMYINKLPIFITISRKIKFGTSELLADQKMSTILMALQRTINIYKKRGLEVTTICMDGQFEALRGLLTNVTQATLNVVSENEHVPEVERYIRTVKERVRSIWNTLPFKKMPARLVSEMVHSSVFWLNCFPAVDGISTTYSPRAIVTGANIDFNKHCRIEFGAYAQVHEDHNNSMLPRTVGALALRPTGNLQGGYYFYSLGTGQRLNRAHWTELPMPADVIDRVHVLARRSAVDPGMMIFGDRNKHTTINDVAYNEQLDDDTVADPNYHPDVDYDDDEVEDDYDNDDVGDDGGGGGNNDENDNQIPPDEVVQHQQAPFDEANNVEVQVQGVLDYQPLEHINPNVVQEQDAPGGIEGDHNENNDNEDMPAPIIPEFLDDLNNEAIIEDANIVAPINLNDEMDARYGPRSGRYNLRSRRAPRYANVAAQVADTAQYNFKTGLKKFGAEGEAAVLSELKQLHDTAAIKPKQANDLTVEERRRALRYLMFLKQKRCGLIKGRGCADGSTQRKFIPKEDASSPTVAIEAVIISCVIDAMENRDVAFIDLPGAFLQAMMDKYNGETVHMKLEGDMAELIVLLDPKLYRKYVVYEGKRKVLYVELLRALYGTLRSALLFWQRLSSQFQEWGFKLNPYDWCVCNKMINGSQCTVLWHIDDIKISHVDPNVVTEVIDMLEKEFGKRAPLTIHRGLVHKYLGMTLDYSKSGTVKIDMVDYVSNILDDAPEEVTGEAITPAGSCLFDVNPKACKLDEEAAEYFHHMVAKLLFLCKRGRPDIQLAVAFLTTRVKQPDVDDFKKLCRVLRYLHGTRDLVLTLRSNDLSDIRWWVDASFATHPDMRSHTGGMMSMGAGAVYGQSTRQKLTTKSSTEAELVGVSDVLPQVLWVRYFLEAQGYSVEPTIIYQDNQSAILLEKHDRVTNKEISVEFCPAGCMVADYFTKPLQGSLFSKFRDQIMGVVPSESSSGSKECVEEINVLPSGKPISDDTSLPSILVASGNWTKVEKGGRHK